MIKIKPEILVFAANTFIVVLLFLLPYYLFDGRLFLGGDDTRLYYAYPKEILSSFTFFSWNNISSLPSYIPNHHSIPFLLVFSVLDSIVSSKTQLFYFAFSLPIILGYLYFQKFVKELIGQENTISIISGLIYILSPITMVSLSYFLTPVWLIALFPIVSYYYLRYVKRGIFLDLAKVTFWSIFLSIAYYVIPWILGLILPLIFGLIFIYFFVDKSILKSLKRTILFGIFIVSSQLFWLVSFIASLVRGGATGLGEKIISEDLIGSFAPTVLSTATDNIIYPLLTHYHRQITIDYGLQLKEVFLNYYDNVLPLSLIFVAVLFIGTIKSKQILNKDKYKTFIFFFISFIIALYFFTVNISFLKDVFVLLGNVPGFAVFRNFTDKFALGYIFIYVSFLSLCLYVLKGASRFYPLVFSFVVIVLLINFIPVKQIIHSPLWTTKDIYTTLTLPTEYLEFLDDVKTFIPSTENVIAFPQTIAAYSVITEDNNKNAYVGTSPFKFFSGVNDLAGTLSYPRDISEKIHDSIIERDYKELLETLEQINVGYVMVTNNIPKQLKSSYIFDNKLLIYLDKNLMDNIVDKEMIRSKKGNYMLYKLKNSPKLIHSSAEISYLKITPVWYEIRIENLKGVQELRFLETYHSGWNLYQSRGSSKTDWTGNLANFVSLFRKPVLDVTQKEIDPYGNRWSIDSKMLLKDINKYFYSENEDGSINVNLTLYFLPQTYLYIGTLITVISLSLVTIYVLYINKK